MPDPIKMQYPSRNAPKWIAAGILICVFFVVDFITPQVFESHNDWLTAVAIGICIGQINLIATWAALAPGNFALRLPWSMLLGVFMWYGLVLGNRVADDHFSLETAVILGIILLGGVVVAQIPLWIARRVFRWRLVSSAAQASEVAGGPVQFYLWHLLVGMFFVSVALAPARIVLPPGDLGRIPFEGELFLGLLVVMICNLVITIPCIWGAFLKSRSVIRLAFGWPFYCAVLTVVEIGVFSILFGSPGGSELFEIMGLYGLLNLLQCATVFGTLLIFRAVGFQLIRVSSPSRKDGIGVEHDDANE